jgi:hypothetical protein
VGCSIIVSRERESGAGCGAASQQEEE